MIRERPTPPGIIDSITVKEVNSDCAKIGASVRASNATKRETAEKRGAGILLNMGQTIWLKVISFWGRPKCPQEIFVKAVKRTGSQTVLQQAMGHASLAVSLGYLRNLEVPSASLSLTTGEK